VSATAALSGTLRLPGRIHFGFGARHQLGELIAPFGSRVLAVVDPFLLTTPAVRETLDALRDSGVVLQVVSDVQPELPVDTLDAAGQAAGRFAPDAVLAIGGGSALDAAKAIALLAAHGGPLDRYYGENAVPGPVVPIIALPTTAGTGSEATPVAVVSDPERELKVGISSPYLIPAAALVDPELTIGAPPSVTAHSGIDALVHAVESYTARPIEAEWSGMLPVFTGRNALASPLALDAVERLGRWLPVAVADGADREAREQVALASLLAGMAFGPTGTHLSHALQYPVGALTKTPHGLGTGLLLPYVLEAVSGDAGTRERLARVAGALGAEPSAEAAIHALVALNRRIGLPASLAEIGVEPEQLPRIAELGMRSTRLVGIAPVAADSGLLLEILRRAHAGSLSDALPA